MLVSLSLPALFGACCECRTRQAPGCWGCSTSRSQMGSNFRKRCAITISPVARLMLRHGGSRRTREGSFPLLRPMMDAAPLIFPCWTALSRSSCRHALLETAGLCCSAYVALQPGDDRARGCCCPHPGSRNDPRPAAASARQSQSHESLAAEFFSGVVWKTPESTARTVVLFFSAGTAHGLGLAS